MVDITAHMVVKNEDIFIYHCISSILPYVNKILICDTGSDDKTVEIIKGIKSNKICLSEKKISHINEVGEIRNEQIVNTGSDWIWILDGDEIYPQSLCEEIHKAIRIKGKYLEGVVVRRVDLIGDIYHYQSEDVGTYNLFGQKGHFAIRLLNKKNIKGMHVEGIYPNEGYYDSRRREVIHGDGGKYIFTKGRLFHAMYLRRSSSGSSLPDTFHRNKRKVELGIAFKDKSVFPEVLFGKKPKGVPDATAKRSFLYLMAALIITPAKLIVRRLRTG